MEKIAIISDIHGNLTAFQAVLADAKREKVTSHWFLGDYLMPGPSTSTKEILNLIANTHPTICLRGNWEGVLFDSIDGKALQDTSTHLYLEDLSQHQAQYLTTKELTWLRQLPITDHITIDGWKINISHHLPKKSWGRELIVTQDQEHFDCLFTENFADIAVFGHIHQQLLRYSSQGQPIINPGSVGQPFHLYDRFNKDLRAQYAILEIDETGIKNILFKKVTYDVDHEVALAQQSNTPYKDLYIEELLTGKIFTYEEKKLTESRKKWLYSLQNNKNS